MFDRTIGYCHGSTYCVKCGESFSYNVIKGGSVLCPKCTGLKNGQQSLNPKIAEGPYCSECGSNAWEYKDSYTREDKKYAIKYCAKCNHMLGPVIMKEEP